MEVTGGRDRQFNADGRPDLKRTKRFSSDLQCREFGAHFCLRGIFHGYQFYNAGKKQKRCHRGHNRTMYCEKDRALWRPQEHKANEIVFMPHRSEESFFV